MPEKVGGLSAGTRGLPVRPGQSPRMLQLTRLASRLQVGARLEQEAAYPGWNPDPSSAVLQLTREVLEELTGQPPKVRPGRMGHGT